MLQTNFLIYLTTTLFHLGTPQFPIGTCLRFNGQPITTRNCNEGASYVCESSDHLFNSYNLGSSKFEVCCAFQNAGAVPSSAAEKASTLVQSGDLEFSLSETGAGQEIAKLLQQQDPCKKSIFLSISTYSREASDSRYAKENIDFSIFRSHINPVRLKQQLEVEYQVLPIDPKSRRAVIANTIRTSRGNGHGWIGYKGQLRLGEPPVEVMMHVRLFHPTTSEQKSECGRLGVNLAYSINEAVTKNNSEQFYKGLIEGIQVGRAEVDSISFQGPSLDHLQMESPRKLLEYGLAKVILVYDGLAISGQSFQNNVVAEIHDRIALCKDILSSNRTECGVSHQIQKWDGLAKNIHDITLSEEAQLYLQDLKDSQDGRRNSETISKIINNAADPIDRKIKEMNTRGFVQGLISEVDSSDFIHMLFERPFSPIYESISVRTSDLGTRYGSLDFHNINCSLIRLILDQDYKRVQLTPPSPGSSQLLRKFTIFKHVQNNLVRHNSIDIDGWIAVQAQLVPEGEANKIIVHLRASDIHPSQVEPLASKITVNLWYGFFNFSDNKEDFKKSLFVGVDKEGAHIHLDIEDTRPST